MPSRRFQQLASPPAARVASGGSPGFRPLSAVLQRLARLPRHRVCMSATAGDGSGEARLLVVEDEEMILELLAGSLRFAGFEVMTAASGAEALRAVAASRPDLVLLDVMMPDGDGFEVVRRMRSSGPHVPVIFLTARDGVRERVAGLALGGDDYVTKPFSLDEVVERIRAVLRRGGGGARGTAP